MKLSQWAKNKCITYLTAYKWFKSGKIPNAIQYDTGTILISEDIALADKEERCVIYCRIFNHNRKKNLNIKLKDVKNLLLHQILL